MRNILFALLAGAVMCGSAQAQELPRLDADAEALLAGNDGVVLRAGNATLKVTTVGIDRETFRYLLTQDLARSVLLVTPPGPAFSHLHAMH